MPDLLRITTPIVNKNQPVQPQSSIEATSPFPIQDTSKVIQTHNQSELMQQNTGLLEGEKGSTLLMNLLKDPGVTVSYLKNIFLLEEIFKLLPANNKTVTREIAQMFDTLLVPSGNLADEMLKQEKASTNFKGELFDLLRQINRESNGSSEIQRAVANMLKSLNNIYYRSDILDAVANGLSFLKENLYSSKNLSSQLDILIEKFLNASKNPSSISQKDFSLLKAETLGVLKGIEESILFSPKLSKILSITTYNLSRYNDNMDYVQESLYRLRQLIHGQKRQKLLSLVSDYIKFIDSNSQKNDTSSQVMGTLINLINHQAGEKPVNPAEEGRIEKILNSLLSSPCNFTPLLHFILPTVFDDVKAFAEVWINPQSDEKDMPAGAGTGKHFLLVIDVESFGRFEAELYVHDKDNKIDFYLFCPPGYEELFTPIMKTLPQSIKGTNYHFGDIRLSPLERSRSLMDVFKSLPYKRVGVDVKV